MTGNLEPPVAMAMIRDLLVGRALHVEVCSGSMSPFIMPGDRVTVVGLQDHDPRVGDILVYDFGRGLATHRMVGRCALRAGEPALVLKGDANGVCDDPVRRADLVGRVTAVVCASGEQIELTGLRARVLNRLVGALSGISGSIWEYRERRDGGLIGSMGRAAVRPVGFAARRLYLFVCSRMRRS